MRRSLALALSVLVWTVGLPLSSASGSASTGAVGAQGQLATDTPDADFPAVVNTVKVVDIDGRQVTLSVSIVRTIPGAPLPDGNLPTTVVNVRMSVRDGALLPQGLRVAGVRFEKLRGVSRLFFKPVTEFSTDPLADEEDAKVYKGDLSDRPIVQRLKTTVRLEMGDRVIRVPMGTLRVQTIPLP